MFSIRKTCIFCKAHLQKTYFNIDYTNYVYHYAVDRSNDENPSTIPFNIFICTECNTAQTKYLGDLNEIYKINHADSTGTTMTELHKKTRETLLKYKNKINNILEIGSSVGFLADLILDSYSTKYTIIEPTYYGNRTNKNIIDNFYENVDDTCIDANTLIISHVFEHFYEPLDILEKISKNKNISLFCLVFPDLEYYINNKVLHVLNTEHTYYIDNDFLISVLSLYGFTLLERVNHKNHSVIFILERKDGLIENKNPKITFKNTNYSIEKYFSSIFQSVERFNEEIVKNSNKNIYAWPSSIHILYLLTFGLNPSIYGLLDNSVNKINKKIYGYNLNIYSFTKILFDDSPDTVILINGGVFNGEIDLNSSKNIKFILA